MQFNHLVFHSVIYVFFLSNNNIGKKYILLIGEDSISLGEKGGSISPLDTSYEKVEWCTVTKKKWSIFFMLHGSNKSKNNF